MNFLKENHIGVGVKGDLIDLFIIKGSHGIAGRRVFRDFLRGEYSEENILFWQACEELKQETVQEEVEEKAKGIYEDYISVLSLKEVSLDSRVREVVNKNMAEPTPNLFDEAQLQIYTLMQRDSYPRFVNSTIYKSLVKSHEAEDEQENETKDPNAPGTSADSNIETTPTGSGLEEGKDQKDETIGRVEKVDKIEKGPNESENTKEPEGPDGPKN